ncbi:unnamed protein product (macronuclear) [Paramecium tetraurelia]|uniref:Uncharacterized protein n=1 Tax=Paramecium tetraurelia TaxID=5888 RepID=A0D8P6_PARTE|nr:uncharacterized protein GSPATT00014359001 [Paramecium tetraurelia]CAK79413.1 unnamed protein product [Paramecium tetraurelia]|eukprot:XP_001446810.1 hypothetical protein (macronuclear) [Paramecium tetraurelia strain d4-2]
MNICAIRHIPYSNKHNRRQILVDQNRAKSSQGSRLNSATHYRCSTQQSNNQTQNQGKMQLYEIQPIVGQLIKNQQQQFTSTQLTKSPSFRVKNYHPQEIMKIQSEKSSQNQLQSNIEKIERMNRINFLGDLLQQMDGKIQHTRQSIATDLATVPKNKIDIFNIKNEQEQNIEELHFYLVESQQRIKQHAFVIEQQKYLS